MTAVSNEQLIEGWTLPATSPCCGAQLSHVAGGTSDGVSTRAVTRCTECRQRLIVEATIRSFYPRGGAA